MSRHSSTESKKFREIARQLTQEPICVDPIVHEQTPAFNTLYSNSNRLNIGATPLPSNQDILLPNDSNYWEGHTRSYQTIMDKLEVDIPIKKSRSQEKNEENITKTMEEFRTLSSNLNMISTSCLNLYVDGVCKDHKYDEQKDSKENKDD